MKLYDFFEDVGCLGLVCFCMISVILIILIVWQVFGIIHANTEYTELHVERFIRVLTIIVLAAILCFTVSSNAKFVSLYVEYSKQSYKTVQGELSDVISALSESRGEYYDVSFCVGDVLFEKTNISITKDHYETLKSVEGEEVSVSYSEDDNGIVVYTIYLLKTTSE